jgi:ribose/xylose/arabinose/galactoside ABC-type transport system permease subunit
MPWKENPVVKRLAIDSPNMQGSERLAQVAAMIRTYILVIIFVILVVIFSLSSPHFTSKNNILLILLRTAPLGIVVAGQTLVIVTGGIDLSVGSVAGLASIIAAKLMLGDNGPGLPPVVALGVALGAAVTIGWAQGWLIARKDLSPFIVTFSTLSLIKGLALVYSNSAPIPISHGQFSWMWRVTPSPRPVPILVMILVFAAVAYILRNTKLGRYAFAIGSNETVARMSGVNVASYKTRVYMVSSFLAGLAGILLLTRIESGSYTNGETYPLVSIAAAVIGGASLKGGVGSAWGSLLGVLMLTMVDTGLSVLNISPLWSTVVIGALILLAALADVERRKAQEIVPPIRTENPTGDVSYFLQTFNSLQRAIKQNLACEHVRLYMIDRETGDLIQYDPGNDERAIVSQEAHLARQVMDTRSPQWLGHIGQDNGMIVTPIKPEMQSVIGVPIGQTNRVIGVLELQSPYGDVFNATTAAKLADITRPAAASLEDAWLLDSGWLLRHTREALRHLWDEVYLSKSPLAAWLYAWVEIPPAARGKALQDVLLNAIECVGEKEGGEPSRLRRRYMILQQTYVEGLLVEEITERLSISRRQYFYNLKEVLEEVVHLILEHRRQTLSQK